MFNYLRSEFYRNIRQKGWHGLLLFILSAIGLLTIGIRFISLPADHSAQVAQLAVRLASMPFLMASLMNLAMVIFMISFATISLKEKAIHIQMISFGLKRYQVYFGDFMMQSFMTILTALFTLTVLFVSFGLYYVSVPGIAHSLPSGFQELIFSYLYRLPLYLLLVIAINTTMQFFYQIIKKSGWAVAAAVSANIIFPALWQNLMAYDFIRKLFFSEWVGKLSPTLQSEQLYRFDFDNPAGGFAAPNVMQIMICFVFVSTLFLTAGYLHYHREEM